MQFDRSNCVKGEICLLLTAILWGSCYLFQKIGMDYIGPYTLGTFRFLIGALSLSPVLVFLEMKNKKKEGYEKKSFSKRWNRNVLLGGGLCGVALFLAATFQQVALLYTTAGKCGFITTLNVVFVALITIVFTRHLSSSAALGTILAVVGMYFLCVAGSDLSLQKGDLLSLGGAFFFAVQILFVDVFVKSADPIRLSVIEFLVCSVLSFFGMILMEQPSWASILACAVPILYTGLVEVGICYTLQIVGQQYVPPVAATITLSLEGVFSVVFGSIFLHERMNGTELLGCGIMFVAVLVAQLPMLNLSKKGESEEG